LTESQDDPQVAYVRSVEDANRNWHATAVALDNDYRQALERPGQDQSPAALHAQYLRRRGLEHTVWQARVDDAVATYRERTGQTILPRIGWTPPAPDALPAPGQSAPAPALPVNAPAVQSRKGFDRARWLPLIIAVGVLLVIAVVGSAMAGSGKSKAASSTDTDTTAYSSTVEVLYEVEGSATGADITMEAPTGTVQGTGKAVPLASKTTGKPGLSYTMPRGHFVYISAQNKGSSGSITCRISVDGVVVSTNTSSGGYAIASCKGTAR
jgi:hypothetical protein